MSHAPSPALERRHQTIRDAIAARALDALVVTSLPNILYLTNFTGSSAIVVLTADRLLLHHRLPLRRRRSPPRAARRSECPDLELVTVDGSYDATLAGAAARRCRLAARRVRGGASDGRPARLAERRRSAAAHRRPGARRDRAASSSARASARTRTRSRRSARRRGGCRRWRRRARRRSGAARPSASSRWRSTGASGRPGSSGPAFDTIVASGPNARAAARAARRAKINRRRPRRAGLRRRLRLILRRLDPDRIGRAGRRAGPEVYAAVLEAHDRAIAAVAPGRVAVRHRRGGARRADAARPGRGVRPRHRPRPRASKSTRIRGSRGGGRTSTRDDEAVDAGHGLHDRAGRVSPGWGGVRIEDDVLVTDDGCRGADRRHDRAARRSDRWTSIN